MEYSKHPRANTVAYEVALFFMRHDPGSSRDETSKRFIQCYYKGQKYFVWADWDTEFIKAREAGMRFSTTLGGIGLIFDDDELTQLLLIQDNIRYTMNLENFEVTKYAG